MKIALGYLLTFGWVFLILGLTMVLKRLTHAGDELSRKIVHVSVAFAWIPMALCFGTSWHLVVPPAVFIVLNYLSYKKGLFSAMERSDAEKQSPGTVYYAVSMTVMALCSVLRPACLVPYGMGLFCMALGDGFAPVFGSIRRGNRVLRGSRTLYGSLGVLLLCALVLLAFSGIYDLHMGIGAVVLTALAAAVLELFGARGLDNLSLPLGVFVLGVLFTA